MTSAAYAYSTNRTSSHSVNTASAGTHTPSLTPPNFAELIEDAARPIGVHWILHERDVSVLQPLTNMFFTLLLEHLLRVKGDPEARVALLLDEFGNLGRIPDFTTTITVARDRGVQRCWVSKR